MSDELIYHIEQCRHCQIIEEKIEHAKSSEQEYELYDKINSCWISNNPDYPDWDGGDLQ